MGDEFHQRNIAASLNFLKEISPLIIQADIPGRRSKGTKLSKFLADTDQFFLNIMMATGRPSLTVLVQKQRDSSDSDDP